jgi:hypothetical protein
MSKPELKWKYVKPIEGEELIDKLAEKTHLNISTAYTAIARKNNGGRPDRSILVSPVGELKIRRLLRIDSSGDENIMVVFIRILDVSPNLFPFGDDSFGNYFCFRQSTDPGEPSVVFFDHETNEVTEIAPSFVKFLDSLS